LYEWQTGEIPHEYTLDHLCRHRWCVEVTHVEPVARAEHARREAARRSEGTPITFEIALFDAIDRPTVQRRTVTMCELEQLLTTFGILDDKRRGRCWSPTEYAESATTRGDAGVKTVTALVFDLDRVHQTSLA
jgi:hypothetical protein